MKKDCIRDYATGAFMRFFNLGCPTRAEYEERIKQDVYQRLALKEPRIILLKAEAEVRSRQPILDDIDAVQKMITLLHENGKDYVVDAIRAVYFIPSNKNGRPSRNEIVKRVLYFSSTVPTDERNVYRWLKHARELFAVCRGLSIE